METKRVFVCADDYAHDLETCNAILLLAAKKRLSAVSCLAGAPLWPVVAPQLLDHADRILIGLHFNLTESFTDGARTLKWIIVRACLGVIDTAQVRDSLLRQIDRFVLATGTLPDFIDGHEHVHSFAQVRDVVADVATELGVGAPMPVRAVLPFFGSTDAKFKRYVLGRLASWKRGHAYEGSLAPPLNTGFSGDYSLKAHAAYAELFSTWLAAAPDGGLIMCHPSVGSLAAQSRAVTAGEREFLFLASPAFRRLIEESRSVLYARGDPLPAAS